MHFNSLTYALFLALVVAAYQALRGPRARQGLLFVASLLFYATWSAPFVGLLFLSIVVDYTASHAIARDPSRKRRWLVLSIVTNLGVLAFFKYADFLLGNVFGLGSRLGLFEGTFEPLHFVLPLGISFYTFQTMSYTIDVYRGTQRPVDSILKFSVYVTFFPQLVAGPIVRAHEMLPQLACDARPDGDRTAEGLTRIAIGLLKKVVLADWLAVAAEVVFAAPEGFDPLMAWVGLYAYAFQIFFDFSGYCDIAIGSALLLGFRLPENFLQPYLATSPSDLWRRWHVTLSTWLRDYLYIPLGGNRRGPSRTYVNLMLTMLLGGLWHGASWTFVAWGALHGAYLIVQRLLARLFRTPPPRAVAIWIMFHATCLAWVFFRSSDFGRAWELLGRLAALPAESSALEIGLVVALAPLLLGGYAASSALATRLRRFRPEHGVESFAYGAGLAAVLLLLCALTAPPAQFVYFQF